MPPAEAGRHHVAYALAGARRRDEQDMLGTVVQQHLFREGIAPDDEAGLCAKAGFFDVFLLRPARRAVARHALHDLMDLKA